MMRFGFIAAMLMVAAGVHGADVVFSADFETDPAGTWTSTTPLSPTGNAWTSDEAHSGAYSLRVGDGRWQSAAIPLQPHDYYRVELWTKGTAAGQVYGLDGGGYAVYASGSTWLSNDVFFRGYYSATAGSVALYAPAGGAIYVDDVKVSHISSAEAAQFLDDYYAAMPQFSFTAPASRHTNLSRTMQKLASGQTLRTVWLGDSIMNNLQGSTYEVLVDRMYSGTKTEVIPSARGSTGCWWYKNVEDDAASPNYGTPRVQSWVLDHDPDLVMIGGISQNGDIESIRSVIDQIQTANPNIDVLLLSEVGGVHTNPYLDPAMAAPSNGSDWRAQLSQLAAEEGVGYWDITEPWADYILASGQPYSWFMSDNVHLNRLGFQVAARTLEAFFAPVPEPATLSLLAIGAAGVLMRRRA